jgi:hypothetical protein
VPGVPPNQVLRAGILRISGDYLLCGTAQAQAGQVLDVGGEKERPGVDDQHAKAEILTAAVEFVSDVSHARPDDDDVKRIAAVVSNFGPGATCPTAENIVGKLRLLNIDENVSDPS